MRFYLVNLLALILVTTGSLMISTTRGVEAAEEQSHYSDYLARFFSSIRSFFNGGSDDHRISNSDTNGTFDGLKERTFEMFMRIYNKTYPSSAEMRRRMALFFKRRQEIERSIIEFAQGRMPFTMRENSFTDWEGSELKTLTGVTPPKSLDEFMPEERKALARAQRRRRRRSVNEPEELDVEDNMDYDLNWDTLENSDDNDGDYNHEEDPGYIVKALEEIPASKDWRLSKCISTPINQMTCGCCYSITTMSVIESMRCLNSNTSAPLLSSQHILDCAKKSAGYQNHGCKGGWPTRVLKYLKDTRVAVLESCYPFVHQQQSCRLSMVSKSPGCTVPASPTNTELKYKVLNNENDILYHVAKTGPVVTVMHTTDRFLYYSTGIFDDESCSQRRDDVDHAIVIVGYGKENGVDYWLIKNSWGTEWGDNGYGKFRRGKNACSIGHWGWVVIS